MFDHAIESDRSLVPETRDTCRMRDGHRREHDPRQHTERISFRERSKRALADVGIYRTVSFRDLAEAHFGGHPYTSRRAVNWWIEEGLVRESTAKGLKSRPFKVLTLTPRGAGRRPQPSRRAGSGPRTADRIRAPPPRTYVVDITALFSISAPDLSLNFRHLSTLS